MLSSTDPASYVVGKMTPQISAESQPLGLSTFTPPTTDSDPSRSPFELRCTDTAHRATSNTSSTFSENRILIVDSSEYSIPTRPWLQSVTFAAAPPWKFDHSRPMLYSDARPAEPVLITCGEIRQPPAFPIISPAPSGESAPNIAPEPPSLTFQITRQVIDTVKNTQQKANEGQLYSKGDRKARTNFTEQQRSVLNSFLQVNPYASSLDIEKLCELTGLSTRQIRTYFTNRRMRHSKDVSATRGRPPAGRQPKAK